MFETSYELDDVGKVLKIPIFLYYPHSKWSTVNREISMIIKDGRRTLALFCPDDKKRASERNYADRLFKDQADAIRAFMS